MDWDSSYNRNLFHSYETLLSSIRVNGFDSGLSATAPGRGLVKLRTKVDGKDTLVLLNNVLHAPSAHINLISGSELDKKGIATWICNSEISLLKSDSVIGRGALWNDLYKLDLIPVPLSPVTTVPLLNRIEPRPLIDRIQNEEEMAAALK